MGSNPAQPKGLLAGCDHEFGPTLPLFIARPMQRRGAHSRPVRERRAGRSRRPTACGQLAPRRARGAGRQQHRNQPALHLAERGGCGAARLPSAGVL